MKGRHRRNRSLLAIDMVDEHGARQAHILGLVPQLGGHNLRSGNRVDDEQGHLGCLHGRERIAYEVGVSRRVKHVDLEVFVRDGGD